MKSYGFLFFDRVESMVKFLGKITPIYMSVLFSGFFLVLAQLTPIDIPPPPICPACPENSTCINGQCVPEIKNV
jgi:hypothetical protein